MRLGLIALSSDILIERDFWRMGLAAGVDIYTTRISLEMPIAPRTLAALERGIADATRLILPEAELDALVFGCTSGAAVLGADTVARRIDAVRAGLALTNPASAAVAALNHLQVRKIAFVAPYTPDVAQITSDVFTAAGIGFSDRICFDLQTDVQIALPGLDHYRRAIAAMDLTGAGAIFLSCTTSRGLDVIDALEAETGLPVITSNQAAFWHALQLAGQRIAVPGFGRLLAG